MSYTASELSEALAEIRLELKREIADGAVSVAVGPAKIDVFVENSSSDVVRRAIRQRSREAARRSDVSISVTVVEGPRFSVHLL